MNTDFCFSALERDTIKSETPLKFDKADEAKWHKCRSAEKEQWYNHKMRRKYKLPSLSIKATLECPNLAVDRLCNELFLTSKARAQDDNLQFVSIRLLKSEVDLASLLELYSQVPRDRRSSFVPQFVGKHQRRFDSSDDKIISLYARS